MYCASWQHLSHPVLNFVQNATISKQALIAVSDFFLAQDPKCLLKNGRPKLSNQGHLATQLEYDLSKTNFECLELRHLD